MIATGRCLSRRTVLRGVGASIALPLLDGMVPAFAAPRTMAGRTVTRLAAVYVPMGVNMDLWTPKGSGTPLEFTPILQPLEAYREHLLVLSGLNSEQAQNRAEDGGGPHSRVQSTWLTGVRARKTQGADFRAGTSMDQIAAHEIGGATQLTSLELALESTDVIGACDFGYTCAYTSTLAWRTPTTPLPMETSPRAVFERLFGDSGSTDPRIRLGRIREEGSILDSVIEETRRLVSDLEGGDRAKLDEYLDAVRDIERRIQKAEQQHDVELPVVSQPVSVPASYEEHGTLMFDLLVLALQSDLTRIATFMMSRELSGRTYPQIGISEPHHPLSHHQNDPEKLAKQAKLNTFHVRMFAGFVEKLRTTRDGDGSLLDHTLVLYGSGMSDSNMHVPNNLPTLLIGGGQAAGIRGGRHLRYGEGTPLANLQLTLLDKLGVHVDRFGDSTGQLNLLSV